MVSEDQVSFFKDNGYIIIRDFLSPEEVKSLQSWAQEVHDWTPTPESEFMPYDVSHTFESPREFLQPPDTLL